MDRTQTEEPPDSIKRHALRWNPQGNRGKGRSKNTWRWALEIDCKKMGRQWIDLEKIVLDRMV
uniref:Uncharacterized protein n=1 Tax=Arion vulgaris TaxID=1028688 RepID=A0A0B7ABQ9_9EUPU